MLELVVELEVVLVAVSDCCCCCCCCCCSSTDEAESALVVASSDSDSGSGSGDVVRDGARAAGDGTRSSSCGYLRCGGEASMRSSSAELAGSGATDVGTTESIKRRETKMSTLYRVVTCVDQLLASRCWRQAAAAADARASERASTRMKVREGVRAAPLFPIEAVVVATNCIRRRRWWWWWCI